MESDTNSKTTVYNTISQFNNSDIETPEEFANSEPSPSIFSQPHFQPIQSQVKIEPPSPPSSISNVTPIYSPLNSEPSHNNDSENTKASHDLGNFITLQKQLQHPQTLTIHQLSQSIISSKPLTPTPLHIVPLRKTRLPHQPHPQVQTELTKLLKENSQILHSYLTKEHPQHLSTIHFTLTQKNFSKGLPFFPQYTYFHSDPNDEKPNYVSEHVLYSTCSWTSFYHFTNPLSLPLFNTPHDNEVCSTQLYLLTTALTPKQFTQIGYRQSPIKFTAPKSNEYSFDYYDHNIIRPNEDIFLNNDPFANPQLTEKIFIKNPNTFTLNISNKNTTTLSQQLYVKFILMIHTLTNLTSSH